MPFTDHSRRTLPRNTFIVQELNNSELKVPAQDSIPFSSLPTPHFFSSASLIIFRAPVRIASRCSSLRKLSAYSLYMSSVPDGRTANQPFSVDIFSPPIGALLAGAWVNLDVIGSPARSPATMVSGVRELIAAFSACVAAASIRI